jgi:hypothetical protein
MGAVRALRVRKSRWPTTCQECLGAITPPELIASRDRGPWVHASHVIDANRAAAAEATGEEAPAR